MLEPIYAFFDFDGTLISGDSILYWLRFYYRHRPGRLFFLIPIVPGFLLRGLGLISSHTLKRIFLWPMSFEKPAELDALSEAFVREELKPRLRPSVMGKLREHVAQGHKVVVISAVEYFISNIFAICCHRIVFFWGPSWNGEGDFWACRYIAMEICAGKTRFTV